MLPSMKGYRLPPRQKLTKTSLSRAGIMCLGEYSCLSLARYFSELVSLKYWVVQAKQALINIKEVSSDLNFILSNNIDIKWHHGNIICLLLVPACDITLTHNNGFELEFRYISVTVAWLNVQLHDKLTLKKTNKKTHTQKDIVQLPVYIFPNSLQLFFNSCFTRAELQILYFLQNVQKPRIYRLNTCTQNNELLLQYNLILFLQRGQFIYNYLFDLKKELSANISVFKITTCTVNLLSVYTHLHNYRDIMA